MARASRLKLTGTAVLIIAAGVAALVWISTRLGKPKATPVAPVGRPVTMVQGMA